jgi:hypothetical protein
VASIPSEWRSTERRSGGTYRTVCVRLCDGFYWPISFATTADSFDRDSGVCTQSCSSPTALYYYPNPGGEPEDMISLEGEPYLRLGKAFLYRTRYDAACKCKPHPWEQEAAEQHRRHAEEGQEAQEAQEEPAAPTAKE